jgi:hypothetical protein
MPFKNCSYALPNQSVWNAGVLAACSNAMLLLMVKTHRYLFLLIVNASGQLLAVSERRF